MFVDDNLFEKQLIAVKKKNKELLEINKINRIDNDKMKQEVNEIVSQKLNLEKEKVYILFNLCIFVPVL